MEHTLRSPWSLRPWKNKQCIIHGNEVISEKPLWRAKNLVLPKSYKSRNPKSWKLIHKKYGVQSETSLLLNYGKVSSLSVEMWESSLPESSS